MFPQHAVVLLVHAHGVLNRLHAAQKVGEVRVKVLDVANTVAALLQAVRVLAKPVFARIKRVFAVVGRLAEQRSETVTKSWQ